MSEQLIWFKGNIVPVSEAMINVLSPTSQFGANVFEGLRGYWNNEQQELYIFRLNEHVKRLRNSVKMASFDATFTEDDYKNSIIDTVRANQFKEDIAIRQTVFLDGFGSWASTGEANMFVAPIAKGRQYPENHQGVCCSVSSWSRISDNSLPPKIKMGANYMNSRLGQMEAIRNGNDFCIFLNSHGKVSEGPGSCLFIVRGNQLITPPITASILESITRETLLTLAKQHLDCEVVERDIDRTELYIADEVFLCGSAVEIISVREIDGYKLGEQNSETYTSKLRNVYFDVIRGKDDSYSEWLTPVYKEKSL